MFIANKLYDEGLVVLTNDADELHICSGAPTTYTQATDTLSLGVKENPTIGSPQNRSGGGREVVVSAITDGDVTDTDTATHWAIVDTSESLLLAAGELDSSQAVTASNPFTTTAFPIGILPPPSP